MAPDVLYETKYSNSIHLHEIINNMKMTCEVYTIARGKRNSKLNDNVYLVKEMLDMHPFRNFTISINAFIKGYKILRHHDIDLIYERHHIFDMGIILSKLFKVPCVLEVNGILIDEAKVSGSYGPLLQKAVYLIENLLTRRASFIIAVTPGIKDDFVKRGIDKKKVRVIPNGANTDLFKPMNIAKAKRELKLDEIDNYVCFVGNLAPWQGVEYLIKSVPMILEKCPDIRFLIVGDGTMRGDLKALAEEISVANKFIFTGTVPYEDVPKYINASDVCIAPFITARNMKIGLSPLKIYEYLACGKPIVSSRIPNLGFIKQNNAGILVEPENPEELANAIIKLLKDTKLREEMGNAGREYVVKNHRWKAIARKVANVSEDVVAKHKIGSR